MVWHAMEAGHHAMDWYLWMFMQDCLVVESFNGLGWSFNGLRWTLWVHVHAVHAWLMVMWAAWLELSCCCGSLHLVVHVPLVQ